MFAFIAFMLKLAVAALLSGSLGYSLKGKKSASEVTLRATLYGISSAALCGIALRFTGDYQIIAAAIMILTMVIAILQISNAEESEYKFVYLLAVIIGGITGLAFILHAAILTLISFLLLTKGIHYLGQFQPDDEGTDLDETKSPKERN